MYFSICNLLINYLSNFYHYFCILFFSSFCFKYIRYFIVPTWPLDDNWANSHKLVRNPDLGCSSALLVQLYYSFFQFLLLDNGTKHRCAAWWLGNFPRPHVDCQHIGFVTVLPSWYGNQFHLGVQFRNLTMRHALTVTGSLMYSVTASKYACGLSPIEF